MRRSDDRQFGVDIFFAEIKPIRPTPPSCEAILMLQHVAKSAKNCAPDIDIFEVCSPD
jgi:hypothetical protein